MQKTLMLVVGLGKTGQSIARYLQGNGTPFVMFDTRAAPEELLSFQAAFPHITVFLNTLPDALYAQLTGIISSPGVPLEGEWFNQAHAHHLSIIGDIECFARVVSAPVVAITGTNGKSTVTCLVGQMAEAAGHAVAVAGNIGTPVLDRLNDGMEYDLWVLELSSFQLDLTESLAPVAASILNITPDHLDRHHTLAAYWAAKQQVYQGASACVFNRDDAQTRPDQAYLGEEKPQLISYGLDEPAAGQWGIRRNSVGVDYLACGALLLLPVDALQLKGRHNWLNALAACALASVINVPQTVMVDVLRTFTGLPHRCQAVRRLHDVTWINDSKGTNVGATLSAISGIGGSMQGKIVLIAGGQGKGADFTSLQEAMKMYVRSVILIGEDAALLESALSAYVPMTHAESLETAVLLARSHAKPGDAVLLSPACASLDMFHDFNHRGDVFVAAVEAL